VFTVRSPRSGLLVDSVSSGSVPTFNARIGPTVIAIAYLLEVALRHHGRPSATAPEPVVERAVVPRLLGHQVRLGRETAGQDEWGAWGSNPEPTD
jgi:hypothetical protein